MASFTLILFCGILLLCVILGFSILYALLAGLLLFLAYGFFCKHIPLRQLIALSASGVRTAGGIMFMMALIGGLTALWRASGTIAVIICYASGLIRPGTFLIMAFLLNCAVSVLTGTSFGTVATIGVICMTMANTMQLDPLWVGGAILSGAFFGDRCSPISTSALLVCTLTHTDIFQNIRRMCRTVLLPFLLCCLIYALAGLAGHPADSGLDTWALFGRVFHLQGLCILPAAAVLLLSLFRCPVRLTLSVSVVCAAILCIAVQGYTPPQILRFLFFGYACADAELASMVNGGGILSMLSVIGIILISSCYAGLFQGTGLLDGIKRKTARVSRHITPFGATLCTALLTSAISCNQTLAAMLTHQICNDLSESQESFAIDLEDTAIVVAPLIPWSIAGSVPLATLGVSSASLPAACLLYLLPLTRLAAALLQKRKSEVLS